MKSNLARSCAASAVAALSLSLGLAAAPPERADVVKTEPGAVAAPAPLAGVDATRPWLSADDLRPGRPALLADPLAVNGTGPALYYDTTAATLFHPRNSSIPFAYGSVGCVYLTTTQEWMNARLSLPDGANVAWLRLFYDRTANLASTLVLTKYDLFSGTTTDIAYVSATGTSGTGNDGVTLSEVVNNITYAYVLNWSGAAGSTNKFCGARIAYYKPSDGTYTPMSPCRVLDTRGYNPPGYGAPPLAGGTVRNFQITGSCGVPTGATGVSANVSVTNTGGAGYVAIWQQGTAWPGNATVNYSGPGLTTGNYAILPLSATGQIAAEAFNAGSTDLIVDVTGYYW